MERNKHLLKIRNAFGIALLLLLLWNLPAWAQNANPYRLDLISDTHSYDSLVITDPDNELVDLKEYIPGIVLDIRYATTNNFTGEQIYKSPDAYLKKPVASALENIQEELAHQGVGLKIFDAYRPYSATLKFYDVVKDTNFVAAPWHGSMHNRGCAVDLTIINLRTGKEMAMPTGFDDFTEKAAQSYDDLPKEVLKNRELLRKVMTGHGFEVYPPEWWHYNFRGCENSPILNLDFEQLKIKN